MFSFVITLAAGVTTAFMDRLYMCLKMANIACDHIVYKGSKLIHGKSVQVLYDFLWKQKLFSMSQGNLTFHELVCYTCRQCDDMQLKPS